MRKIITTLLAISLAVAFWVCSALAAEPTTDKEILFLDIPFGCSEDEFIETVTERGVKYNDIEKKTEGDGTEGGIYGNIAIAGFSGSFGIGDIIEHGFYDDVQTRVVKLKAKKSNAFYWELKPIYSVAGYDVETIEAEFLDVDGCDSNGLYVCSYNWSDITNSADYESGMCIPFEKQYYDLKEKLSSIYGEPYKYENESYISGTTNASVWIGANNTAVILEWNKEWKDLHISEYIHITYGKTDIDSVFKLLQSEIDRKAEELRDQIINKKIAERVGNVDGL